MSAVHSVKERQQPLAALIVNSHKVYEDTIRAVPFYGKIIGVVEQTLKEQGYYMIFYAADNIEDVFEMVTSWDADGIIALTFSRNDCDKIAGLCKCPIVSIDAYGDKGSTVNIGLDDWQGGYDMGSYLFDCGYSDIYVCAGRNYGVDKIRYKACQDVLMKQTGNAGQNGRVRLIELGMSLQSRRQVMSSLLNRVRQDISKGRRPALFCLSDLYALEAMNYFVSEGVKVPKEVGIAGFDDIFYASIISPGLTTVRQDMKEKARLAVEYLISELTGIHREDIDLPVRLVKRGSTSGLNKEKSCIYF